jgi:multidrug efflux pump subunit AcrA (membrane-fusion protein)
MTASCACARPATPCQVPLSALFHREGRPAVWVVEGERVRLVEVVTGELAGNAVSVSAGLQPGQRVVSAGVQRLEEGQRVVLADSSKIAARP